MQIVNVADIKVKEGITKEGARAGQKWELTIIVGDDGSEFTTFDAKAQEVGIGGIIELEPVVKSGKTNFTEFTIKKKGQAHAPKPISGGDSPEKRQSIENQTRAYIIADLFKAGKLEEESSQVKSLLSWLDKLGFPGKKADPPKPDQEIEPGEFKNVGALLTAALKLAKEKEVDFKPQELCDYIGVKQTTEIADLASAWRDVQTIINKKLGIEEPVFNE